jgi:hypothetical protein
VDFFSALSLASNVLSSFGSILFLVRCRVFCEMEESRW